jgi:hypothetical protein
MPDKAVSRLASVIKILILIEWDVSVMSRIELLCRARYRERPSAIAKIPIEIELNDRVLSIFYELGHRLVGTARTGPVDFRGCLSRNCTQDKK